MQTGTTIVMNDNLKNTVGNMIGNSKDIPIRLTTTGNFENLGVKHDEEPHLVIYMRTRNIVNILVE